MGKHSLRLLKLIGKRICRPVTHFLGESEFVALKMQRRTLPPPHPSLPNPPVAKFQTTQLPQPQTATSYVHPAYPTYFYGSHYAQAYVQQSPMATAVYNAGYTKTKTTAIPVHLMSSWYQPGNSRCSHPGCQFFGSEKSVETHMMDRHLIFPPGWERRKKKPEWDADPSLRG